MSIHIVCHAEGTKHLEPLLIAMRSFLRQDDNTFFW